MLRRWRCLTRSAGGLALLCGAPFAQADSFDDLRLAWGHFTTGGTNLNLADAAVLARLASIQNTANAHWSSLNTAPGRTYLWSDAASTSVSAHLTTCYNRLLDLAEGWVTPGTTTFSNATLAADLVAALDWMYANRYNETKTAYDNWWDWEIGSPTSLGSAMLLMYPTLSGTQITNYCKAVDKFTPAVTLSGANRVWQAQVLALRGVAGKNAGKLTAARDGLGPVFPYVTSGDGFYRDGSFIQHGKHPYTGGYGLYLIRDVAKLLVWLDGSAWAVSDPQRTNVIRWVHDSFEPLIYRGALPAHVRGREISRTYGDYAVGHAAVNTILRLAQSALPAEATRLRGLIKYWGQSDATAALTDYVDLDLIASARDLLTNNAVPSRGELIGHYQFPSMDRVMHLRPGFGFGLSLFSTRTANYESINNENWQGWFTAHGMTYLWNADATQYTDAFWPTVDPYHLAGTTVDLTPRANGSFQSYASSQPWVGGAWLTNGFGAAGLALDDVAGSLAARKSWFLFDDEIVCLGAGITCASGTNVHTSVENRRLNSAGDDAFAVNGLAQSTSLGWSSNLTGVSWCALDGTGGFVFPSPASLTAARRARSGRWSDLNAAGPPTTYTRNYLTLWFDHGINPVDGGYAYVSLPNLPSAQVSAYAANPDVLIVENSPQAQAVREKTLGLLAVNFWNATSQTVDFITANNRASVIAQETLGDLTLAVSDPTQTNTSQISLTLNRSATGVLFADAGVTVSQIAPAIQVSVNLNGRRGQPARVRFLTYSNSPPGLNPVTNRVLEAGQWLAVTNIATDVGDLPQELRYQLATAPAGAAIDSVSGVITWQPTTNQIGTNNLFTVIVMEDGWRTNLSATADAFVRNGFPTANYGTNATLEVRLGSSITTRETYLRFGVPARPGAVREAQLRLTSTNLPPTTLTNAVALTVGDSWTEDAITWDTRPGYGPAIATWRPGVETGADLTAAASGAETVGGSLSLAVYALNDPNATAVSYVAREGDPSFAPQLRLVTTNGPALSATQSFWALVLPANQPPRLSAIADTNVVAGGPFALRADALDPDAPAQRLRYHLIGPAGAAINASDGLITWQPDANFAGTSNLFTVIVTEDGWVTNVAATADTFVRSGFLTSNYGTNPTLEVRLGGSTTTREVCLRFELPPVIGNILEAGLRLTPTNPPATALTNAVAMLNSDAWNELTVTWSNWPGAGPPLATWRPAVDAPPDVASAARDARSSNGRLGLAVYGLSDPTGAAQHYWSREGHPDLSPQLSLVFTNGSPLSATQSFWVTVLAPPPASPPRLTGLDFTAGAFSALVQGDTGGRFAVQVSSNLSHWTSLWVTNPPALPFSWRDPEAGAQGVRFYRVLWLGP